jgi:hypothetical protein
MKMSKTKTKKAPRPSTSKPIKAAKKPVAKTPPPTATLPTRGSLPRGRHKAAAVKMAESHASFHRTCPFVNSQRQAAEQGSE